ncbi:hypothetical protein Back2_08280 [Nocardioides baekrokdamisoli]|uniref:Acetyl-CoA carboxylase biotin carboxyl carrier protein subunit n=1 Tax=Nocardioides baekrokdamisoli TaxID=1804624 RepID=A0A3G9ISE2_9ACTN|nr:acyl-CoA carboxylase epsilon subunit [Nocardioides baekrokdamisoli]BBH16541.1 hypothetical protein Back2_08280 [Nocardioides baekrokdamisoli]
MSDEQPTEVAPAKPMLQVINADATPEQIAAIVAVFAALGGGSAPASKRPRSLWATPQPRLTYAHGLGGWRASGLPR